ncbi:NADH-quinone oxidoreductase subunit G [Buchnera aphidicola (Eriosoma lanigerum)]
MIIIIDGEKYNIKKDVHNLDNLLSVFLSLGFDVPYFCWHPALGSVGSCRQCAVKLYHDIHDTKGRLVMSCMTAVQDGLIVSIHDKESIFFRKSIIELLMINHPHDCPICEEGGSCHLQDMTVISGHTNRRYRFVKRTHLNQNIGPFMAHNMNRCISCYRCVRYYKDYADGTDFGVYGISSNLYFGRMKSGNLENQFSGNLIEICPTGVFTDKTHFGNYTRKWDLQYAPSICQHCSIGCNISAGERYGTIRKIENRYNKKINHYFLCDRGRFSYGHSNIKDRPNSIRLKKKIINIQSDISKNIVLKHVSDMINQSDKVIGIGSVRASIESNYALQNLVGVKNFSNGMIEIENQCIQLMLSILKNGGIYTPSLAEIEDYDCIIVFGEDLTQTSPRAALAIRQAIKQYAVKLSISKGIDKWNRLGILNVENNIKYPLVITNIDCTELDNVSVYRYIAPVVNQARLGFAIAHELDCYSPVVDQLDHNLIKLVKNITNLLLNSKKPLIISGSHSGNVSLIQASFNIAKSLKKRGLEVGLALFPSSVNSFGVGLLSNLSINQLLNSLVKDQKNTIIILEHDLYRTLLRYQVDLILKYSNCIIIDHQNTKIFQKGHISLPSSNLFESSGTVINYELRPQRFFQVYDPTFGKSNKIVFESWKWLNWLKDKIHYNIKQWLTLDDIINSCIKDFPIFKNIKKIVPNALFRINGQKIARSPHRYSGRTALYMDTNIHEPRQPKDDNSMFSFSMEGNNQLQSSFGYIPFTWSPGWNSIQSSYKINNLQYKNDKYSTLNLRLWDNNISNLDFFNYVPDLFIYSNKWIVVPYYFIFGSDELSQYSTVIKNYNSVFPIVINRKDALKFNFNSGDKIYFNILNQQFIFFIQYSELLESGQIGIPIGTPGIPLDLLGQEITELKKG